MMTPSLRRPSPMPLVTNRAPSLLVDHPPRSCGLPAPAATRPRPARSTAAPLLGSLALLLLAGASWAAPQPSGLDPKVHPPASVFRTLQLTALACSRENSTEPCDQARQQADVLLDHPRLPASCKDNLWAIRQQAVVAASSTYQRREALDRVAQDLVVFCRERLRPGSKTTESAGSGGPAPTGLGAPSGLGPK